jgi:hypothetical protein
MLLVVVLVAVVAAGATNKLSDKPRYSNTPGRGALLQRTQLPPLDTAKGGPIPLPPGDGHRSDTHYPAQQAVVQRPISASPPVTDRAPGATPQDPQLTPRPGVGSSGGRSTASGPLLDLPSLSNLLPACDAACVTRVLTSLGGGTLGPITVPPVSLPTVPTP